LAPKPSQQVRLFGSLTRRAVDHGSRAMKVVPYAYIQGEFHDVPRRHDL